jgi:hypothetical protein
MPFTLCSSMGLIIKDARLNGLDHLVEIGIEGGKIVAETKPEISSVMGQDVRFLREA